jgi:hypothetical protein
MFIKDAIGLFIFGAPTLLEPTIDVYHNDTHPIDTHQNDTV